MFDDAITWDNIAEKMRDSIDLWEGGLKTTGGAIVPEKGWIYPLDFVFDTKVNAHYRKLQDMSCHFTFKNQHDERITLQQHEANFGKEILGVFLAPDGNNEQAFQDLLQKAKKWSDNIRF